MGHALRKLKNYALELNADVTKFLKSYFYRTAVIFNIQCTNFKGANQFQCELI